MLCLLLCALQERDGLRHILSSYQSLSNVNVDTDAELKEVCADCDCYTILPLSTSHVLSMVPAVGCHDEIFVASCFSIRVALLDALLIHILVDGLGTGARRNWKSCDINVAAAAAAVVAAAAVSHYLRRPVKGTMQ